MPNSITNRRKYSVKQCDKGWFTLDKVEGTSEVRYCDRCEKSVHWCKTEEDLREATIKGLCVAGETKTEFIDVQVITDGEQTVDPQGTGLFLGEITVPYLVSASSGKA